MSDFFTDLEGELRRATVRRAAAARAARVASWRRAPIAAAVAAALLLTLAGGLLLSPLLQRDRAETANDRPRELPLVAGVRAIDVPVPDAVAERFALLRRPQQERELARSVLTKASALLTLPRNLPEMVRDRSVAPSRFEGRVLLPSVRTAEPVAGVTVMLIPFRPAADDPDAREGDRALVGLMTELPRSGRGAGTGRGGTGFTGDTPSLATLSGDGALLRMSSRRDTVFAALVPDGVVNVALTLPAVRARAGLPAAARETHSAVVRENVAVIELTRHPLGIGAVRESWYDGEGRAIRQQTRRP